MIKKSEKSLRKTAKRYAIKLLIDIKHDILFGQELMDYIVASVKHDTGKSYHNDDFYYMCEDEILNLYEKYVIKCSCCNRFVHQDATVRYRGNKYCNKCNFIK